MCVCCRIEQMSKHMFMLLGVSVHCEDMKETGMGGKRGDNLSDKISAVS